MYYSTRSNSKLYTLESNLQFWNSYLAYLRKLVAENYFFEKFGDFNEFDNVYTTSTYKLGEEMLIWLGFDVDIYRSISRCEAMPDTNIQLDVIEFAFQYVSKPLEYEYDEYHKISYPSLFDTSKGRYDYTVSVNRMLQRNRIAYKLDKGRITRVHDEILDNRFQESDISYYAKLDSEVRQAVELFTSRNPKNIKTALTVIANAFELAKTLTYPEDKKKSVNEICKSIAGDSEKLRELLNGHFLYLTDISNNCDIRHKESNKIIIEDGDIQEYLFYTYYNAIRLMIEKLPPTF